MVAVSNAHLDGSPITVDYEIETHDTCEVVGYTRETWRSPLDVDVSWNLTFNSKDDTHRVSTEEAQEYGLTAGDYILLERKMTFSYNYVVF